jgi:hypothetical protein
MRHWFCVLRQRADWLLFGDRWFNVPDLGLRVRLRDEVCMGCGIRRTVVLDTQDHAEALSGHIDHQLREILDS